jgi:hypothetical protein
MDIEDLQHRIYEIMETKLPVSFQSGTIGGHITFTSPTPYMLKLARLKSLKQQ